MKLLLDQNLSFRLKKKIEQIFPDCKHVSDCGLQNSNDLDIWNYARKENFTVVTYDTDFFELTLINGAPPKVIWIRSQNLSTNEVSQLLNNNYDDIKQFIVSNNKTDCLELGS